MIEDWIQKLKQINLWVSGEAKGSLNALTADSREIEKQPLLRWAFFARKGTVTDGHQFLSALATNPSIAVVFVENRPEGFVTKVPVVEVRDATEAMAVCAQDFYGHPTEKALTVAVTGTNGKTTSTYLVQNLLKAANFRTARMGTVETSFEDVRIPSTLTTPDFAEIQKIFRDLRAKGANSFVFEASSHALHQRRLLGLDIDIGIFTQLTSEHLDYHPHMEAYFRAKASLFSELLVSSKKTNKFAVLPDDGAYGSRLIDEVHGVPKLIWAFDGKSDRVDLQVSIEKADLEGTSFSVRLKDGSRMQFRTALVGRHNIENIMGMIGVAFGLKLSEAAIQKALDATPCIPGRLELIPHRGSGKVFVDYAHTPDALENVLMTLRPLTPGRLRVVFGCGGDRDRGKRPKMGAVCELHADELFVTSDNPRTENPDKILEEILQGLQRLKPTVVEADRRAAIQKALEGLREGDAVLIAGKGHENYQILGTTKIHFDDREEVRKAFSLMEGRGNQLCLFI